MPSSQEYLSLRVGSFHDASLLRFFGSSSQLKVATWNRMYQQVWFWHVLGWWKMVRSKPAVTFVTSKKMQSTHAFCPCFKAETFGWFLGNMGLSCASSLLMGATPGTSRPFSLPSDDGSRSMTSWFLWLKYANIIFDDFWPYGCGSKRKVSFWGRLPSQGSLFKRSLASSPASQGFDPLHQTLTHVKSSLFQVMSEQGGSFWATFGDESGAVQALWTFAKEVCQQEDQWNVVRSTFVLWTYRSQMCLKMLKTTSSKVELALRPFKWLQRFTQNTS